MNRSTTFNGKTISNPGVYSGIDSNMTYSKQVDGSKIIALIGESTGGEPNKVHFFSNPSDAKKVLKSGELLKACQKAWNPVSKTKDGVALGGADIIACIRSNKATRAQKVMYPITEQSALVEDVIKTVSDETTGNITVSGTYLGNKIATYVVEITSGGTVGNAQPIDPDDPSLIHVMSKEERDEAYNDVYNEVYGTSRTSDEEPEQTTPETNEPVTPTEIDTDVRFNVYLANDTKTNLITDGEAGNVIIPGTGLTISFHDGNYLAGDTFMIPVYPAVDTERPTYAFVSKDYGRDNNKIQVKVEDASLEGAKRITVYDVKSDTTEVYDNMGFAFTLAYTGKQNYATVSIITDGDGKAIRLQTKIGPDKEHAIVDLDIELDKSVFKTIRSLVRNLQAYEDYSVVYSNYCNTFCSVNDLDRVSDADIKTNKFTVTQMLSDISRRLSNDSSFIELEIYDKEIAEVANTPYFSLSGGSEGKVPASWVEYFDMLGRYDIKYIVPLTSDDYILTECSEHVTEMSETFGMERRAVVGTDYGKTVAEAMEIAQNIDNDRVQFVYPGIYDANDEGEIELYPSYILAAQFAGRLSALPDGETATHDVFKMYGIEKELDPVNEIPKLLRAGVVTFEFKISTDVYNESYVQCVQDITTSRDTDILRTERAVGVIADGINQEIREGIKGLSVGRKTVIGTLSSIKNVVERILDNKKEKEQVIIDYKDVSVTSNGDVINVEYSCAPSQPNNFTFINGHFYAQDLAITDTENQQ